MSELPYTEAVDELMEGFHHYHAQVFKNRRLDKGPAVGTYASSIRSPNSAGAILFHGSSKEYAAFLECTQLERAALYFRLELIGRLACHHPIIMVG